MPSSRVEQVDVEQSPFYGMRLQHKSISSTKAVTCTGLLQSIVDSFEGVSLWLLCVVVGVVLFCLTGNLGCAETERDLYSALARVCCCWQGGPGS